MAMSLPDLLFLLINFLYNIADSFFAVQRREEAAIPTLFPVPDMSLALPEKTDQSLMTSGRISRGYARKIFCFSGENR